MREGEKQEVCGQLFFRQRDKCDGGAAAELRTDRRTDKRAGGDSGEKQGAGDRIHG